MKNIVYKTVQLQHKDDTIHERKLSLFVHENVVNRKQRRKNNKLYNHPYGIKRVKTNSKGETVEYYEY